MKNKAAIFICLLLPVSIFSQQGATCGNPYVLTIDGVTRTFAAAASTGNPVICSYSNGKPLTYFSFTTNASGECVLLNITAPTAQPCEVALYTASSCSNPSHVSTSGMCFDDGTGLWAPAETYSFAPNTTYYLRIYTTTTGDISIAGQYYTPPNDDCYGAFTLSPVAITDNNACHHGGPGVTPGQLCAFTLENTAFYRYTVANTGTSTIYITNIACDNGNANNSNGFQIGFFTGTCAALVPLSCSTGSGTTVTATTNSLTAGTNVYVAVDGVAGANCNYQIRATNSEVTVAAYLKYFSAWKTAASNLLKWVTLQEFNNKYFEIERSTDGTNFTVIARINGELESYSEKLYQYEDRQPPVKCFYRLKETDIDGKEKYYKTIVVIRSDLPYIHLSIENPATNNLLMNLQTNTREEMNMKIISLSGILFVNETIKCKKGDNRIFKDISSLPVGMYHLVVSGETVKATKKFIKTDYGGYYK
jgi:hypothetical protein